MPAKKPLKKVPEFASTQEEAEFWEHNDSSEFELGEDVEVVVAPQARTKMISIRLPVVLLDMYKRMAAALGEPYQRLMKRVLERYAITERDAAAACGNAEISDKNLSPAQRELVLRAPARTESGGATLPRAA